MRDDAQSAAAATDVAPRAPGVMTPHAKLIARLREHAKYEGCSMNGTTVSDLTEAADALEAAYSLEPTEEMVEAGAAVIHHEIGCHRQYAEKLTRAALTAALGARRSGGSTEQPEGASTQIHRSLA